MLNGPMCIAKGTVVVEEQQRVRQGVRWEIVSVDVLQAQYASLAQIEHQTHYFLNAPLPIYSTTACLLAERPKRVGKYMSSALAGLMV